MNIEDRNGTTVVRRTGEYKPKPSFNTWLIGRPLQTADSEQQTIGKFIGLAVFSSDAMSSVAYAPQEMLIVLVAAGTAGFAYSIPLAIAIVVLLTILTLSYEQTIHAYPNGGGAYIVSRDNLGEIPALVAASALLTDYILTVAVSISSGVAQVVSALPNLEPFRVTIAVGMVVFITVVNLRGIKESGSTFAIPSYFFVFMMVLTVVVGLFRFLVVGSLGQVIDPPQDLMGNLVQPITIFLILKAFSSGTTALTGVEAISNGITAFKEPRSKNAGTTLIMMAFILGSLMLGITFLSHQIGVLPSEEETVISQLARTVFDSRGVFYLAAIFSTMVILMLAANTAFAGFPWLAALTATDGYLPRQLTYRGSRLVYSRGIIMLAAAAILLIFIFQANVTRLIPLYAIGVFLSFTLSQSGMAHRWYKTGKLKPGGETKERGSMLKHDPRWWIKMIINGLGAAVTLVVTLVFSITKFTSGAYIVLILIPLLVFVFLAIHRHYKSIAKKLSLDHYGAPPHLSRNRVILAVAGVHRGTLAALRYARTLSDDITAVHVSIDPLEAEKLKEKWETWGDGIRLVILESPYRLFLEPMLEYIDDIDAQRQPNDIITVVVPQFVTTNLVTNMLHMRTADTLRHVLLNRKGIVINEVPYQVD
ncbi:MAG TPA: APC family permease [Longilinea sp.]|nr:APC family permease [Longilinea sp.]